MENENQENENIVICADCGAEIFENNVRFEYNGDVICENCFDDEYFLCEHCGEVEKIDFSTHVENVGYVCENCLDNFDHCADCGEYFADDNGIQLANGDMICNNCFQNGEYYECGSCGEYYHENDLTYYEDDDCYLCPDCYETAIKSARIYEYHDFNDWQLFKTEKEKNPPFYIGFELETQPKGGDTSFQSDALDLIYSDLNAICARDGSLGSGGFEIISHPQSFKYIFENESKIKFVLDKLIEYGYTSHDNNECGLHFHVTRPKNPEVIDRLWLILETYKKEIILLSRRKETQQKHWAQFLSDALTTDETEKLKALYFIKKTNKSFERYLALNNRNEKTIEFRFFKGTLKSDTFFACVEFINNLVTLCSNLDIKIESITWDKLCKGKYISKYITEKNIFSSVVPVDKSLEYIKQENAEKLLMQKIYNAYLQQARHYLNNAPVKTTNIKGASGFYDVSCSLQRYHRDLCSGFWENFSYIENYLQEHRVAPFMSRVDVALKNYGIEPNIKEKIQKHFDELQRIIERSI